MFSTRFTRRYISWIDIGAPDKFEQTTEPVFLKTFDDYFWSVSNEGVRIGESNKNAYTYSKHETGSFEGDGVYTIFDTGASDIFMSVLWFDSFAEKLFEELGGVEFYY